jgi:hypothetical protein
MATETTTKTTKPIGNGNKRKIEAAPNTPTPKEKPGKGDPALRLLIIQVVKEIMDAGEFEFEVDAASFDKQTKDQLAKFEKRLAALEAKK